MRSGGRGPQLSAGARNNTGQHARSPKKKPQLRQKFVEVPAPTDEALQSVLHKIITRTMKLLTRRGVLVEEEGSTYMADNDGDSDEAPEVQHLKAKTGGFSLFWGVDA